MKKLLIVDLQKGFINESCDFLVDKVSKLIVGGDLTKSSPQSLSMTKTVNLKNFLTMTDF